MKNTKSGGKGACLNAPNRSFKGFTLAEVLITLVVIGVVAALTMPMIIPRIEKIKTEAKLKKFYNTISRATVSAIEKNGEMKDWDYTDTKVVYEKYYKNELQASTPYYYSYGAGYTQTYMKFNDGTCAKLSYNKTYGPYIRNYSWEINLNCGAFPQQEGLTIFQLGMYNFLDSSKKCNYEPSGCGWIGDKSYSGSYKNRMDKASCLTTSNYAWKSYDCYLKFVQDGMRFTDDYYYYNQPRVGNALSNTQNYWKKIK